MLYNRSLGDFNLFKKQNLQEMYPAETNFILSLAMSICSSHICLFEYNILTVVIFMLCNKCCAGFLLLFYLTFVLFHIVLFFSFLGCTVGGFMHRHGNLKYVFFFWFVLL